MLRIVAELTFISISVLLCIMFLISLEIQLYREDGTRMHWVEAFIYLLIFAGWCDLTSLLIFILKAIFKIT